MQLETFHIRECLVRYYVDNGANYFGPIAC